MRISTSHGCFPRLRSSKHLVRDKHAQVFYQPDHIMYKIIGADGKEYGPINLDQLKRWFAEGRLNLHTKVLPHGETEWKTLGDLPELTGTLPPPSEPTNVPEPVDRAAALRAVRGPAIFILVLGALNIVTCLLSLLWTGVEDKFLGAAELPPETLRLVQNVRTYFSTPAMILGIILAVVTFFGAIKMLKLKSHGLAVAAAIIMMIPCGNCCCFLNIGAGIWALVVLLKPEIKSAFE